MKPQQSFDVIIVGGSYSGLAAGMALGRSLKQVVIIDSGLPCNRQTPHSHNFITHDGKTPAEIAALARQQLERYDTVQLINDLAISGNKNHHEFDIQTSSGATYHAKKLIFATGIRDILPPIDGLAACWGISVIHCPYCHGYEVRNQKTGILGNGEHTFDYVTLISNWTKDLTLFTNGKSILSDVQKAKLHKHQIKIVEKEMASLAHVGGQLQEILFKDQTTAPLAALYAQTSFEQHCPIPQSLGCELTEEGYIKIDPFQKTTVHGIFACGDNTTRMRTVANAVGMGTTAGMMANKEMVMEAF
jgi:thioredoxin reductase